MNKKKYVNIFYMFWLVVACVIFSGNSHVNASVSVEELQEALNTSFDNYNTYWNTSLVPPTIRADVINSYLQDYDYFVLSKLDNSFVFCVADRFYGNYSGGENHIYNSQSINFYWYYISGNTHSIRIYGNQLLLSNTTRDNNICVYNTDIYTDNTYTNVWLGQNFNYNVNSITLTPGINSFKRFSGVGDNQQLNVNLVGYEIDEFYFYIQKYINNEWQTITGNNDFYLLYDTENDDIFRNPYYVFWHNISYLDSGTYRYIATKTDDSLSTWSNSFEILPFSAESTGTATGTYDNGNISIDINIDNGNVVTGIIDYLNEEPADAKGDIEREINKIQNEIENKMQNDKFISSLEDAERGFLDVLNEPEGDFVINWDDIYYMNTVLIPAGTINFSKMCRDNQTLGQIKNYINIIISFGIAIGIIKYIYNLVLSTLGIDNPYLYEKNEDETTIFADMDTGEITGRQIVHRGKKGRIVYRGRGGGE